MRIAYDAKRAFWNKSGLGNYSRSLITLLDEHLPEVEMDLYTPKVNPDFPMPERTHIHTPERNIDQLLPSRWRSRGMLKDLKKNRPDLYHGLSNELPFGISRSGIPSLVTVHDLIFFRYPRYYKRLDREIYRYKFRRACREADKIVAISRQTKEDIMRFLEVPEEKISIVYQGCNPAFYTETEEGEKQRIRKEYQLPETYMLYVGTIEERKNLLGLIKARKTGKISLPLVAIGRQTAYFEKVRQYVEEQQMEAVHFVPYVNNNDLPAIYQMADVFVYPSFFEGFGIPILEALNSDTPVVTSTGSCFRETGGEAALYANPAEPADLADKIKQVLQNTSLRKQMIEQGRKHALQFREENIARNMYAVYKRMV